MKKTKPIQGFTIKEEKFLNLMVDIITDLTLKNLYLTDNQTSLKVLDRNKIQLSRFDSPGHLQKVKQLKKSSD